ncbi:MAG: hypothetical protein P8H31_03165, partial [Porticoccaceae bacterium]|nr:hypothetical protein [Porticoccaceae bacterium]
PDDRVIDGVDQTDFFLGKKSVSNRDSFIIYSWENIYGVKWTDWKHVVGSTRSGQIFHLLSDPKERNRDTVKNIHNSFVKVITSRLIKEHKESLKRYPPVLQGTPDPYEPPAYP